MFNLNYRDERIPSMTYYAMLTLTTKLMTIIIGSFPDFLSES